MLVEVHPHVHGTWGREGGAVHLRPDGLVPAREEAPVPVRRTSRASRPRQ